MGQITCYLSGIAPDGASREGKTFGDSQRPEMTAWKKAHRDVRETWYVRSRISGKSTNAKFPTRAAAVAYDQAHATDNARGIGLDNRKVRFAEYAGEWLACDPSKRPSTRARDRAIVQTHLLPELGTKLVRDITRKDVQGLVNRWTTEKSPSTVGRQFTTLQAIMSAAVRDNLVGRSPCVEIRLPERPAREAMILDPATVVALADAVGTADAPMVYLGAVLGLRWGEVAGLRVGDIDLDGAVLGVNGQRTRGEKGQMVDGAPKSRAGRRQLALPPGLVTILAEHLAAHPGGTYVFTGPSGRPLHYSNWRRRVWVPACDAVGLSGFRFHDLRHVAATALVLSGVDVKTAQVRLGHSSPQVTLGLYAQVTSEADRRAAQVIGEHFFAPTKAKLGRP